MVALSLPRVVLGRARIRIGSVMGIRQAVRSAGAVALLSLLTTAPPWAGQAPGFGSIAPGGAGFSAERLELFHLYAELRANLAEAGQSVDASAWVSAGDRALELLKVGRKEDARRMLRDQVQAGAGRQG